MLVRFAVLAAVVFLAGCAGPTSILLIVDGDVTAGTDFDDLTVSVSGSAAAGWTDSFELSEAFPWSLRILPGDELSGDVEIQVSIRDSAGPVIEANRDTSFVGGEEVVERLCLWRACRGVESAACRQGLCDLSDADGDADVDGDSDDDGDRHEGDADEADLPDADEEGADADIEDRPSWDMRTFDAITATTGDGRVDFQVATADTVEELTHDEWLGLAEVRALGSLEGRYLGLRARLVSPDGLSKAALGRVAVAGQNGLWEWVRPDREVEASFNRSAIETEPGVLALTAAPVSGGPLPSDEFDGPEIEDRLWQRALLNIIDARVEGGRLAVGMVGDIRLGGRIFSTYALRGDFDIRIAHEPQSWPALVNGEYSAGLRVVSGTERCLLRRVVRGSVFNLDMYDTSVRLHREADSLGEQTFRLERVGGEVVGYVDPPTWRELGRCSLGTGDVTVELYVDSTPSDPPVAAMEMAFDDFEVISTEGVVGFLSSSPEVAFDVADAEAPRVAMVPETGVYQEEVTVELVASPTSTSVYYTLDGSDPVASPSRSLYEGPLLLSRGTTVTAIAENASGAPGPEERHRYLLGSLVAHAPLDEPSGEVLETVHGWNGTSLGVTRGVAGIVGGAVEVDGLGGYIELPDSSAAGRSDYQLDDGALSIWLSPENLYNRGAIFSKDSSGFDTGGHLTVWHESQTFDIRIQSIDDSYSLSSSGLLLRAGQWYRATIVFGSSGLTLWIADTEGHLLGEWSAAYFGGIGPSSGGVGNQEPIALGVSSMLSDDLAVTPVREPFAGRLDELQLYSFDP